MVFHQASGAYANLNRNLRFLCAPSHKGAKCDGAHCSASHRWPGSNPGNIVGIKTAPREIGINVQLTLIVQVPGEEL